MEKGRNLVPSPLDRSFGGVPAAFRTYLYIRAKNFSPGQVFQDSDVESRLVGQEIK